MDAAKLVVKNLRPQDQIAVVTFDDHARVVVPLQYAVNKSLIMEKIDQIEDGGSTNLTGGWSLGRDELRKVTGDAFRRLLLLSDGQLNVGIVEPQVVCQIVGEGLEQDRIRTSCLGLGDGYDEDLMSSLAQATNGQFYDVDSPDKMPGIIASELSGLQHIAVQNLRLRLKPLDFCDGLFALGNQPANQLPDGRIEFCMGDLVSEEELIACFALSVLPLPCVNNKPVCSLEGEKLIELEVVFDEVTETEMASRTVTQTIRIQATQDAAKVQLNGEVIQWIAVQKTARIIRDITQFMDQGEHAKARRIVENSIREIQSYGKGDGVQDALRTLDDIRNKIDQNLWSARERKEARYCSESFSRMSSNAEWSGNVQAPSFKRRNRKENSNDDPTKNGER